MSRARLLALVLTLFVLPFALVACDEDGNSEDEDQVTEAIVFAATSGDPAACTEAQTLNFTEQITGVPTGDKAIEQCEEDAADTPAEEVDVSEIEVDGDSATAEAAVTGSFFDGQTLELALVRDGEQWKLDEFVGFVDFDREAMAATLRSELSADEEASPEAVDCVIQQVDATSDEDLEAAFIGEDPEAEDRLFEPCSKFFGGE